MLESLILRNDYYLYSTDLRLEVAYKLAVAGVRRGGFEVNDAVIFFL